ncbi:hypothetical protein N7478_011675 [Penicillium angulare]|uniref:uncharacterized protein n=1 Tax=Penicillium angulare TaxID=116970 RepID=UPI00253FD85F|nr:uncharacterized protein N7478_011675 [Penicillium angulare]KAJ5261080.1 hypothetical protein N7478_011675 [Penicillium angulare]
MLFKSAIITLATIGAAVAQRPSNESICDYYTTALLKQNNATNQYTLLTLLVNTVVIGNYTQPNVGVSVPGILSPKGMYNGTKVNLMPYFDGGLASSNNGSKMGVAKNFLDGGAAAPLMKNMPADDKSSNQYKLMTHLYQFFGSLLGCSGVGMTGFSAYSGHASMYEVHKFMVLDPYEVGYFIEQVGLAAASFGVAKTDINAVVGVLESMFDYRCAPKSTAIKSQGLQYQSICSDEKCPLAMNSTCAAQPSLSQPLVANSTLAGGEGSNSTSMSGTPTSSMSSSNSPSSTPNVAVQYTPELTGLFSGALLLLAL